MILMAMPRSWPSHEGKAKRPVGSGEDGMTCKDAIDLLADYLESTLTEAQLAQLEEHLKACDPCVAYLRTYRRTKELAARAERVEMPEEMKVRLRQFLLGRLSSDQP